jgi:hypothetical protein
LVEAILRFMAAGTEEDRRKNDHVLSQQQFVAPAARSRAVRKI